MALTADSRLRLDEVERRVCDIASEQLGIRRDRISPGDGLIEDLKIESLDTGRIVHGDRGTIAGHVSRQPIMPGL